MDGSNRWPPPRPTGSSPTARSAKGAAAACFGISLMLRNCGINRHSSSQTCKGLAGFRLTWNRSRHPRWSPATATKRNIRFGCRRAGWLLVFLRRAPMRSSTVTTVNSSRLFSGNFWKQCSVI